MWRPACCPGRQPSACGRTPLSEPRSAVTLGTHAIVLPPLPAHRGYAKEIVELSHQLDGILRVYRGDRLLISQPLPLEEYADGRPVHMSATLKKSPMPHIYKLSGR